MKRVLRAVTFLATAIVILSIVNIVAYFTIRRGGAHDVSIRTAFPASEDCYDTPTICFSSLAYDDHDGVLYTINGDWEIVAALPGGRLQIVAGRSIPGLHDDPRAGCLERDGVGPDAIFCYPRSIAYDADRRLLVVADQDSLRGVTEDGVVTTLTRPTVTPACGDFELAKSHVCRAMHLAIDSRSGAVYAVQGEALMRLSRTDTYELVSGADPLGYDRSGCVAHDGMGPAAAYCFLGGVAVDESSGIWLTEGSGDIVMVNGETGDSSTLVGQHRPFAGSASSGFVTPGWIGYADLALWEWTAGCIQRDGLFGRATVCAPSEMTSAGDGSAFFLDGGAIRKIDGKGRTIVTIADGSNEGDCAHDTGSSRICDPRALAFDPRHRLLYVLDSAGIQELGVP